MYHLFENPIRRGKLLPGRAFFVAVAVGTAAVIGLALDLPDDDPNVLDLSTASPGERPARGPEGHAAGRRRPAGDGGGRLDELVGVGRARRVGQDPRRPVRPLLGARLRRRRPRHARLPRAGAQLVPRLRAVAPRHGQAVRSFRPGHGPRGDRARRHLAPQVPRRQVPQPRRPRRSTHGSRSASSGSPARSPPPARRCAGRRSRTSTSRSAPVAPATRRSWRTIRSGWTSSTRSSASALADVPNASMVDLAGYMRSRPGGELDPSFRPRRRAPERERHRRGREVARARSCTRDGRDRGAGRTGDRRDRRAAAASRPARSW